MKKLTVDFAQNTGKVKIMHSVNNGPVGDHVRGGTSNFDLYKEAEIPYARNHDAAFCGSYGGEFTVDVHRIFPDFDADVNDPASYVFTWTDRYLKDVDDAGTKTFYRLGASIEFKKKVGTIPPKDFQKWAEICEHIIRHYTEGWADGFHYDIEYWEIWNEPNCGAIGSNPCWQGTPEQFMELFVITLRHLQKNFPHLKFGGPALCNAWDDEYNDLVFSTLRKNNMTMDFFSFHGYRNEPYLFDEDAEHMWLFIEKYNLAGKIELIFNEWNYIRGWYREEFRQSLETIAGLKGASFIAGTMCVGQKSKLDHMMYYDAQPHQFCGMFDLRFYTPLKGYYPFKMYSQIYKMGQSVLSEADDKYLYSIAAKNENTCGIMFTYFVDDENQEPGLVEVDIKNCEIAPGATVEYYVLDEDHDFELVRKETISSENATLFVDAKLFGTYFIKIIKK
ncbi:MAG: hypothetical protein E7672_05875 [Ruminococcaceae bacterium]|nr:hypothetical protein [Oscillospiraceae bacterium]